ncbi:MAG: hypothetical protein PHU68_01175 [Paludibacter sp.]|nr:hypothetical protein [Paludibacter sp.]
MSSKSPIYQPKKSLAEQRYEVILAHILDPENSPIPVEYQEQFNRVISAAKMLDNFHPSSVIPRLQAKYRISTRQARTDIQLSQELFKSKHTFDWDYWQQWQLKDLVDIIRTCKLQGKHKERVAAHKVLQQVIGEKQVGTEDPKRMEKNVYYIQLNNNSNTINIPLDKVKGLSSNEIQVIVEAMSTSVDTDEQIAEILDT